MAASRWYFTREQIRNSPSVRNGIDYAKELGYRQQCANFIQDIGQRLTVNQLCINTSIVYMHRFYMFHSFKDFHRNVMAPCFLFLGAKVEEQPRKLEHVLKVAYRCLHKDSDSQLDNKSDEYMQMAQDLIDNESILLQTLGFELSVEHPHTFVVNCIQMVKAAKDLAQTSYFLATNSLHLTTFCIEQKPTVVACVCIYVACKWTSYEIPESHDKKHWWEYIDNEVTLASIEEMTSHFIKILDSCPTRLKKKISTGPAIYKGGTLQPKREHEEDPGAVDKHNGASSSKTASKDEKGSSYSEKHRVKNDPSSDPSKLKERKEHAGHSHGTHSKHQSHPESHKNLELDRKHAEHHKHRSEHKHRHSEHNKHKSELSKHDEGNFNKQIAKKRPDSKDNTMKIPEIKSSSSMSKPTEKASVKDSESAEKAKIAEEPSAAAKMILSLPPLQHKHSLPDAEKSSSESPAKKKKLDSDSVPAKKPKLDLDSNTVAGHPKAQTLPSGKTSDDKAQAIPSGPIGSSSISGSHHKRHKSSHSKHSSSKDKHKEKVPGDKHSSHHHKQQSSHKSSHGQKHHTKTSSQDSSGGSKYSESDRGSASDIPINESPRKHVSEYGSQKDGHNPGVTASRHHKPVKTPQKSSSDPSGTFMKSTKTPQKSQAHPKLTPKTPLPKSEDSLPPPPPPPCVDMSVLSPPPSVPTEMYPNANKETPSKLPASAAPSPYGMPAMQMRQPGNQAADQLPQGNVSDNSALLNSGHMHHNMLPMQHTGMNPPHIQASPSFPRQSQYLNTSQASSAAGSYGISPMYFQGKDGQSTATNLPLLHPQFVSPQKGNLHPPPLPPPGFVLTQISGLPPPPPPLNLPFPPPP